MDVEIAELDPENSEAVACLYDLEPHIRNDTDFPRANRFRQVRVDGRYMKRGDNDFSHLPDLYVLTITNFDPFGMEINIRCAGIMDASLL